MGAISLITIASLPSALVVKPGSKVTLSEHKPDFTTGDNKSIAKCILEGNTKKIANLQRKLYAQKKYALLVVLQGMDASGKDGTIRHVLKKIDPQGQQVTPFRVPTSDELMHDYLWRIHKHIPPKGTIGVFNRSHYEDVLVPKVKNTVPKEEIEKRYEQINNFERMLSENNIKLLKFFLYISKEEQKKRFTARIEDKTKNWKLNPQDLKERKLWGDYLKAYEDAINNCSTEWAPWYIIPADHKWFRNLAISEILLKTLEEMELEYPAPSFDISDIKID